MAKKKGSLFTHRSTRYAPRALTAAALGFLSVSFMIALTLISMAAEGKTGRWAGAVGFSAFVAAFFGMAEGLKSFREPCRSYTLSKVGTLFCAFMVAGWFLVFCIGLAH